MRTQTSADIAFLLRHTRCIIVTTLLPLPKKGGYVFTCACLSVSLSVCPLDYTASYERILMNSWRGWGVAKITAD